MTTRKKAAFTLAEVLITLMILGVIATLTIPALIKNQQEKITITRLKSTYSILYQAHLRALADNGPFEDWDISPSGSGTGATKLLNYYKPYLSGIKTCNQQKGCFADNYKALFGNTNFFVQPNGRYDYATIKLANGVSAAFGSFATGAIFVDINGTDPPNRAGVDYFAFRITSRGIIPNYPYTGEICQYNNTNSTNGLVCTQWVINHGNMDYLRRDVSAEW